MEISIEELKELLDKAFEKGKKSNMTTTHTPYTSIETTIGDSPNKYIYKSTACKMCSNNPDNGGNGVCDCILGMTDIIY